jgi:hypothetical protein
MIEFLKRKERNMEEEGFQGRATRGLRGGGYRG